MAMSGRSTARTPDAAVVEVVRGDVQAITADIERRLERLGAQLVADGVVADQAVASAAVAFVLRDALIEAYDGVGLRAVDAAGAAAARVGGTAGGAHRLVADLAGRTPAGVRHGFGRPRSARDGV